MARPDPRAGKYEVGQAVRRLEEFGRLGNGILVRFARAGLVAVMDRLEGYGKKAKGGG